MTDYKALKLMRNGCEYCFPGGGVEVEPRVDFLLVGGGGAMGAFNAGCQWGGAGGGGGGGVIECFGKTLCMGCSYNITIGAGGTFCNTAQGGNGGNSTAFGCTVYGGGGGGRGAASCNGSNGGSGGGASMTCSSTLVTTGGTPTISTQGSAGGCALIYCYNANYVAGAGGGGAGGNGGNTNRDCCRIGNALRPMGGDGGKGYVSKITNSRYGGGGGGAASCCCFYGCGGCGYNNCGGGGGTYRSGYAGYCRTNGLGGVAVIRYHTDGSDGITCATGGTVTTSGDYTIHCFTSNGTFTIVS